MIRAYSHMIMPGSNYVQDPSAENSPRNTSYWYANGSAVLAFDTAEAHSGNRSMKVTTGNTAANNGIIFRHQRLFGAGSVRCGVWYKGPAGVRLNIYTLRCWATMVSWSAGGAIARVCTGAWDYYTSVGVTPVTYPQCLYLRVLINEPTVGVSIWVDDAEIVQVT